jgi:osmotically-inducible protein OsmY
MKHSRPQIKHPFVERQPFSRKLGRRNYAVRLGRVCIALAIIIAATLSGPTQVWAQVQSNAPADRSITQNISKALIKAGIDPRITSVRVITTSNRVVYLSGLISDAQTVKLAAVVAARTAPGYRVVNNIRSSFFDDPNHVNGGITK